MSPPPSSPDSSSSAPDSSSDQSPEATDDTADEYTERILKGATFIFSGSMIGKVVGFTLQLVLARGFGKALYGLYTVGLSVLRLGQAVATLGMQNGIVRFGAPQYERGDEAGVKGTFLASAGIGLAAGTIIGGGLYFAAPWLARHAFGGSTGPPVEVVADTIAIFGCGLPFYVLTYLASRMARAAGTMQIDTLLDSILQPALFLVLVGGVLVLGHEFRLALYAFLTSTLLAAGIGVYAIYRLFPPLFSRLSPSWDVGRLLRFSIPIVGVTLATMGLTYTDRLMLGILSTSESVGLYQAAATLATQMHFILSAVTASFSPIISDLYQNGRLKALSSLYADTVRWIIVITLPAALVLFIYAPEILSIWGPEFEEGAMVLRLLTAAHFVVASVGSVGLMLQMSDHQDFVFTVNTSTAILNVVLNWILIRSYGAVGAALATGFSQAVGDLIEVVGLYYFLSVQPFRWILWKPLAAGAVTLLGIWGLTSVLSGPARWVVGIPALLLIYGGLLFGLGLHSRDRSILRGLWAHLSRSGSQ